MRLLVRRTHHWRQLRQSESGGARLRSVPRAAAMRCHLRSKRGVARAIARRCATLRCVIISSAPTKIRPTRVAAAVAAACCCCYLRANCRFSSRRVCPPRRNACRRPRVRRARYSRRLIAADCISSADHSFSLSAAAAPTTTTSDGDEKRRRRRASLLLGGLRASSALGERKDEI